MAEENEVEGKAPESEGEAPGYEESFGRVEELVKQLESGDLSLEQSIRRYEDAVKAMNRCYELLDEAQKKIEVLIKDSKGRVTGREEFKAE